MTRWPKSARVHSARAVVVRAGFGLEVEDERGRVESHPGALLYIPDARLLARLVEHVGLEIELVVALEDSGQATQLARAAGVLERRDRRRTRPIAWHKQPLGRMSDRKLARRLGVSSTTVLRARRARNIPAFPRSVKAYAERWGV